MATTFAARLKYLMAHRGIGPNELERQAELSKGYASRLQSGRAVMPTVPTLRRIATALQASFDFLVDGKEPPLVEQLVPPMQVVPIGELEERFLEREQERRRQKTTRQQEDRRGWEGAVLRALEEDSEPAWAILGAGLLPWDGRDSDLAVTLQEVNDLAHQVVKRKKLSDQERVALDQLARRQKTKMKRAKKVNPPASSSPPHRGRPGR